MELTAKSIHAFTGCDTTSAFCDRGIVCDLYGYKGESSSTLRYRLYSSKQGRLEAKNIPPCFDNLRLHSSRAIYQSFVWRNCLIAKPEIPSPLDNG